MEVAMQKIYLLLDQNRYAEARGMIMQALAQDPQDPQLNSLLALCLRMENRAQEGLEAAQFAVGAAPDWPFTHYVLAAVYQGMEKWKAARTAIDQAIALDPHHPDYHGMKATILYNQSKWKEAIEAAESGLAIDPEHGQCRGILTATKNQLGQHDDVAHLVDETLRQNPEDALAFANKGWSCLRQGNNKEAVRHFKEALRLEPDMEWARIGALEALKANNPPYRWLLAYFFKMGALSPQAQFGVLIGLYVMFRVVRQVGENYPEFQPITMPLVIAYIVFAYTSWVGMSLANCFLLFHPYGRLAMNHREKRNAIILGATVFSGIGLLTLGHFGDFLLAYVIGMALIMVSLPLVGTLNAHTPRGRLVGGAVIAAFWGLGIVGVLFYAPLIQAALILWVAYVWIIGHYVARH